MNDEEIRQLILDDPKQGWSIFWEAHGQFVHRMVDRYDLSPEDREEILQEIQYSLIKQDYKTFRIWDPNICSMRGFLSIIASYNALNFLGSRFYKNSRSNIPLTEVAGVEAIDQSIRSSRSSPSERLHRLHLARYIKNLLDNYVKSGRIQEVDKQMILLRLRGHKFREIAEALGMSTTFVTVRFTRLKPLLRKRFEEDDVTPFE